MKSNGTFMELETACDLGETSLREVALRMQPSFSYTLHACHSARFDAYELARAVQVPDHPFAPYINVVLDADKIRGSERWRRPWWLDNDRGEAVGSMGA